MSEFAVVDASVAFKWLVEEEYSDEATALTQLWIDEGIPPTASSLMPFEVAMHFTIVWLEVICPCGCDRSHAEPDVSGDCAA